MDRFNIVLDTDSLENSRSETELENLREELKKKQVTIEEKNKIISSLRQQVDDLRQETEELENNEQILTQKVDRLNREVSEKNEELEAVSHALKEVESANESLTKRLDSRTQQVQKFVEDLAKTKKQLDEAINNNERLQNQNELLSTELETARTRKRVSREREDDDILTRTIDELKSKIISLQNQNNAVMAESTKQVEKLEEQEKLSQQVADLNNDILRLRQQNEQLAVELKAASSKKNSFSSSDSNQTNEELIQELYDLRAKVKSLSHRQSRRSVDEEILKLKHELEVTETSWKAERHHKERYARENVQLEKKLHDISKELNRMEEYRVKYMEIMKRLENHMPPPLPPKTAPQVQDENKFEKSAPIYFSMADEVGEIMDCSSLGKANSCEKRDLNESSLWHNHNDFRHKRNVLSNDRLQSSLSNSYCHNHRIQKSQFIESDLKLEQQRRLERAKELARRNQQTKPLHQTSYALELDTFDSTNFTETQIKHGNVHRQALADSSNQRKPTKKAEAFVV